jgi:hypothetical protein
MYSNNKMGHQINLPMDSWRNYKNLYYFLVHSAKTMIGKSLVIYRIFATSFMSKKRVTWPNHTTYVYFWWQHSTDVRSPYTRNAELTQSSLYVFLFHSKIWTGYFLLVTWALSIRLSFYIDNLRKMSDAHSRCHKICKAHIHIFVLYSCSTSKYMLVLEQGKLFPWRLRTLKIQFWRISYIVLDELSDVQKSTCYCGIDCMAHLVV